ncbi:MAG: hypothetical protein PHD37_02740 [Gallionellaceae bacterium]|nr:hypothetical protein [Gallionellaceae bacterium]
MRTALRLGAALLITLSTVGCSSMVRTAMVDERASPYNMEETVKIISERARQKG